VQFFGSLSVALPRSAKRKANFGPQIFAETSGHGTEKWDIKLGKTWGVVSQQKDEFMRFHSTFCVDIIWLVVEPYPSEK